jgi:hypothetical protein
MPTTVPRYLPTYRQAEIRLISDFARRGQSLCLVGVAGSGKSNIVNLLRTDPYGYKATFLGAAAGEIHFPVVAGPTIQGSPQKLWEAMSTALNEAAPNQEWPKGDDKIRPISAEQGAYSLVRAQVKTLCQERGRQVMFVFDDFDGVLREGPLAMLEQLAALRNDGNRDRLSYLVFTKRLPHLLGQSLALQDQSKFYDLFRHHIYALPPYEPADARQMLRFLNENGGQPVPPGDLAWIASLAGGHAGLLFILYDIWRDITPTGDVAATLAQRPEVRSVCRRILHGLHEEEQQTALALARGQWERADPLLVEHLETRRLLTRSGNRITWFSDLFGHCLQSGVE